MYGVPSKYTLPVSQWIQRKIRQILFSSSRPFMRKTNRDTKTLTRWNLIRGNQDTQKELAAFKEAEITFSLRGVEEDFVGGVTELRSKFWTVRHQRE